MQAKGSAVGTDIPALTYQQDCHSKETDISTAQQD